MVIFTGKFVDGLKSEHGKEIYDSKGKIFYEGGWNKNLKNGHGIEYYRNGAYFAGQFVDNLNLILENMFIQMDVFFRVNLIWI